MKKCSSLFKLLILLIIAVLSLSSCQSFVQLFPSINKDNSNIPDQTEPILGTYVLDLNIIGSDIFTFTEGNKVIIESSIVVDGTTTVIENEYTYVIFKEHGKNYIKLTNLATGEVNELSFDRGTYTKTTYICSNESCTDENPSPTNGNSKICNFCRIGTLTESESKTEILFLADEVYEKIN